MHGRLKVKTTAEQQAEKNKERKKKLALYNAGFLKATQKRENKEYDDVALNVTYQLLLANPDIYTIWNFRREILLHLTETKSEDEKISMYKEELKFTESCLRVNHKSYGAWHQRCWVLDTMSNPDWTHELNVCNEYLKVDERNFHVWDYRRFIVSRANFPPAEELEFTMEKINSNFSNYSAWHYRSKLLPVIHGTGDTKQVLNEDVHLQELELVQNAAFTDPNDQSAWFYHRWLLGRVDPPLQLSCFYVNQRRERLCVCFTKPVSLVANCVTVAVSVNEETLPVEWHPTSASLTSAAVWVSRVPRGTLEREGKCSVTISVTVEGVHDRLTVALKEDSEDNWALGESTRPFRLELGDATVATLQQELDSCQQLQELEPDSKWTLLTGVLLMGTLDAQKFNDRIMTSLDRLMEVDPDRLNYYKDLRTKFVLEQMIETRSADQRQLVLSQRQLTTIYHSSHMMLLTTLDVSWNQLRSLHSLHPLQCLTTLKADHNDISGCQGLETLVELKYLSLAHNKIATLDGIRTLQQCPSLAHLVLTENHVCQNNDLGVWCRSNLSQLDQLAL